jgi:hypothetical protein
MGVEGVGTSEPEKGATIPISDVALFCHRMDVSRRMRSRTGAHFVTE